MKAKLLTGWNWFDRNAPFVLVGALVVAVLLCPGCLFGGDSSMQSTPPTGGDVSRTPDLQWQHFSHPAGYGGAGVARAANPEGGGWIWVAYGPSGNTAIVFVPDGDVAVPKPRPAPTPER